MPKLPDPDLEEFAQRLAANTPVIDAFMVVVPGHRYPGRQAGAWARRADVYARVLELRAIYKGAPISEVPEGFEPDKYVTREWILWTALDNAGLH
jgi:hypothetical protein